MGVNKVIHGGRTLVDLTNTTVTPETLLKGATAFDSKGNKIEGNVEPVNTFFVTSDGTSIPMGALNFTT